MVLDDLQEQLQEKWYAFLDWTQDKGLPLRSIADSLEDRGIPSLPAFTATTLAVILGLYFFAYLPLTTLPTTSAEVALLTNLGQPVQNATILLVSAEAKPTFERLTQVTDNSGHATFKNVPTGKIEARAYLNDFDIAPAQGTLKQGVITTLSLTARLKTTSKVQLNLQLKGPAKTQVLLFATNGTLLDNATGNIIVSFNVNPNTQYRVKATAEGYSPSEKLVNVEDKDTVPVTINLYPKGQTPLGKLKISVRTATGIEGDAITNAQVEIKDATSAKTLFQVATDKDGNIAPLDIALGTKITATARATSYHARSTDTITIEEDTSTAIRLALATDQNTARLVVNVIDENGAGLTNAIVKIFDSQSREIDAKQSLNGIAAFNYPSTTSAALATAYRQGFLPSRQANATGTITLILHKATAENSANLNALATDEDGSPIAGATITAKRNGFPLGITPQDTQPDGTAFLQDLPANDTIDIQATSNEKTGTQQVTLATGNNSATIILKKGTGNVEAEVIDHFTQRPISSATVSIAQITCTTSTNGKCTANNVPAGTQTARVNAPGFDDFESAPFNVQPNALTQAQFHMIETSVAQQLRLEFQGFYDSNGRKVENIAPFTRYTAKYLLAAPKTFNFIKATAHVRIGDAQTQLDSEPAEIVGFDSSDANASIVAGENYEQTQPQQNTAPSNETNVTSAQLAATDRGRFKWVEFSFEQFQGTREIAIVIQTKNTTQTMFTLNHRSAFVTDKNEILRSPPDAEAGISKNELLANTQQSAALPVSLEGECQNDYCLSWSFEGRSGKTSAQPFDAAQGEQFAFKITGQNTQPVLLTLSSSAALSINDGATGTTKAQAIDREGKKIFALQFSGGEAAFLINADRVTQSAALTLQASNAQGEKLFEKNFTIRVTGSALGALRVSATPQTLLAGQNNKLSLTIQDSSGRNVENALVTIGTETDAMRATTQLAPQGGGVYSAEVTPANLGTAQYSVQAEGFKQLNGQLQVSAKQLVSIETQPLAFQVNSKEGTQQSFDVENLLDSPVLVHIVILRDSQPSFTTVNTPDASVRLAGKEKKTITVNARISDLVNQYANKQETLQEAFSGRVRIVARAKGIAQEEDVRYAVQSTFSTSALDDAFTISPTTFSLSANPPATPFGQQVVTIKSNALVPLLINTQALAPGLAVTPLSLVVPPQQTATFTVQYAPTAFTTCTFDTESLGSRIDFIASVQGTYARKSLPISITASSSDPCAPLNPVIVTLPFQLTLPAPAGFKTKNNADGSIAVSMYGTRVLLPHEARVANEFITLPRGAQAFFPTDFVQPINFAVAPSSAEYVGLGNAGLPTATLRFSLPSAATLALAAGFQISHPAQNTIITLSSGEVLSYPVLIDPTQQQGGIAALTIPAGVPFTIEPSRDAAAAAKITKIPLSYEKDATITLPAGTVVQRTTDGKTKAILPTCQRLRVTANDGTDAQELPSAKAITFSQTSLQTGAIAASPLDANIPARAQITVEACGELSDSSLLLTFAFPGGASVTLPQGTILDGNIAELPACQKVFVATTFLTELPSAQRVYFPQGSTANGLEVRVPSDAPLSILPCNPLETRSLLSASEGDLFNIDPSKLDFSISDDHKTDTKTVCIYNNATRSLKITPGPVDAALFDALPVGKMRFLKETYATFEIAARPEKPCYEFQIEAQLPASSKDAFGCVARDEDLNGQAFIKASDGRTTRAKSINATVHIKKNDAACPWKQQSTAGASLNDFSINYANDKTSERTGKAMQLSFKDAGHSRPIALINNRPENVKLQITHNTQLASCDIPETLQSGEARIVKCTSSSSTGGSSSDTLEITATGARTNENVKQIIAVTVFAPSQQAKALYTASPWGDTATLVTYGNASIPQDAFVRCEKHYCNYEQVTEAYTSFLQGLRTIVNNAATSYPSSINALCDATASGPVRKAIIIQKVASKQTAEFLASKAQQTLSSSGINAHVTGSEALMSRAGIYTITAQLNLLCGRQPATAEEWKRQASIEIEVSQLPDAQAVPENIANAALLTQEAVEGLTGNQLASFASDFKDIVTRKRAITDGVHIGNYAPQRSKLDESNAIALSRALYGTAPSADEFQESTYYSDAGFCALNGKAVLGTAASVLAGDVALLFSGVGTVQAASAFVQSVTACAAITSVKAVTGTTDTCEIMCDCALQAIAAQSSLLFPGASFGTRAGAVAAITESQRLAFKPTMSALGASFASRQTAMEFIFGAGASGYQAFKGEEPTTVGTQIGTIVPQSARLLFGPRTRAINQLVGSGLSLTTAERAADGIIDAVRNNQPVDNALLERAGVPNAQLAKTKTAASAVEKQLKDSRTFKRTKLLTPSLSGNFLRASGVAASLAAIALTTCNLKPVQTNLQATTQNHLVTFTPSSDLPSTQQICIGNDCTSAKDLCPQDSACIALQRTSQDPQGYLLIATSSDKIKDPIVLYSSVFQPDAPPVTINAQTASAAPAVDAARPIQKIVIKP
ncbi:MAG TPA: carboxypeptidase-like regulatory domain-containing protein [Candidatus Norongarragalinales archaeon]|nr:carboxypeptidase-like regulatory domain-containing protein [Candidatus Norongarragalinales archaeon]